MSAWWRALAIAVLALLGARAAAAQERITNFDVDIEVEADGDMIVTETIDVVAEGVQIRRGIFRELPSVFSYGGVELPYNYQIVSISRDGIPEPYTVSEAGNAVTWRIGSPDVRLDPGPTRYQLRYVVPDQIRYGPDGDELYWNATGTYWQFPIESASATVRFPEGARITDVSDYQGPRGSTESAMATYDSERVVTFTTTRPLAPREGLTVSATVEPGVLTGPSEVRRQQLFWIRWGAPIVLGGGGLLVLLYYLLAWNRVGRDPQAPPVFPRYRAPDGYSPAMVNVLHYRKPRKHDWLTAQLMQLANQGHVGIEADEDRTVITPLNDGPAGGDGRALMDEVFPRGRSVVLDGRPDTRLHKALMRYQVDLMKRYARTYRSHNTGRWFLGVALAIAVVVAAFVAPIGRGPVFFGLLVAIAVMVFVFYRLLQAPTSRGAEIASEVEGFRLYLETAEADRINTANPLGERPPAMSVELYERFLPFAIALGVEKPWTRHFERVLPREAAEYTPSNISGSSVRGVGSPLDMNTAVASALTAGVAAAAPVSQSSGGGSGGGGSSGGGGGGGGGGGW